MIAEAIPTPYDITGLPTLPLAPGWWWWIAILGSSLFIILILRGLSFRTLKPQAEEALNAALLSLKELGAREPSSKELLAEASLIVRRFLSVIIGEETRSASLRELDAYASAASNLRGPIAVLKRIESLRFSEEIPPDTAVQLFRELVDELRSTWPRDYTAEQSPGRPAR